MQVADSIVSKEPASQETWICKGNEAEIAIWNLSLRYFSSAIEIYDIHAYHDLLWQGNTNNNIFKYMESKRHKYIYNQMCN